MPNHPFKAAKRAVSVLAQRTNPVLVQLVVTRRCNLTCGYCNEYDDVSPPVPFDVLAARIDHLASLGTLAITLTGGEPFLHPELDRLVERITSHGIIATSISNAYPITKSWIERMNKAGLNLLQISVDNMEPNEVSQKSWSKIKERLKILREHARFRININAVLGSSPKEQTRELVSEIQSMGFYMTVGLLHDDRGNIVPGLIQDDLPDFYREMRALCNKSYLHQFGEGWEDKMLRDGTATFRCRAGARYLYVDEFGNVNYCSQRRGEPGVEVLDYTRADLKRAWNAPKGCEDHCTIACVRRASSLDERLPQRGAPVPPPVSGQDRLPIL